MKKNMAFTLTTFIYPLPEKIILSKNLGYELDNPRTPDEINFVLNYILPAIKWSTGGEHTQGVIGNHNCSIFGN